MEAYFEPLSRLIPSFVVEACEYAARGKLSNPTFLPSSGELYQLAEELQSRHHREQRLLLPKAPQLECQNSFEQKQRIIAGFKQLLNDIKTKTPIDPAQATADVFWD